MPRPLVQEMDVMAFGVGHWVRLSTCERRITLLAMSYRQHCRSEGSVASACSHVCLHDTHQAEEKPMASVIAGEETMSVSDPISSSSISGGPRWSIHWDRVSLSKSLSFDDLQRRSSKLEPSPEAIVRASTSFRERLEAVIPRSRKRGAFLMMRWDLCPLY